ncbi:anhydro-N-acetylmuramic acid kinase [Pseudalkalibacillus caeni]|uniref:Anhydro-N-acetylmuramic acid kinase n=1 Tax=Exobacillus caeni TaxID=2574798 RepID=A0A5R9F8Y7_9BACL|nr:anhydro-N-acetylmuramic acid kinase [Pseudalkalibacillus caeni]TLS38730.1 anhydro-N-acetylmuramic acid kinase [Pseudalkalibacillus caeni]
MKVAGVMSGTSLDGMDIAIVDFQKVNGKIDFELCYFTTVPYEKELKARLEEVVVPNTPSPEISSMNMLLGEVFADGVLLAVKEAGLQTADIDLISTHGQTVFHDPVFKKDDPYYRPNTLQIGDIGVIAEKTGIPVIGDFRTRDVAVGGQGAPLVPFLDYTLFKSEQLGRVLVNIGGISNVTVLPKSASAENIIAYDTGPGNMIIDAFVTWHTNGEQCYDKDGQLAAKGNINQEWLKELLAHTYYGESPPKSTGREQFGTEYARDLWNQAEKRNISKIDRIATVTALTWYSLGKALKKHIEEDNVEEIYISGGGLHNASMMKGLKDYLPENVSVESSKELGIDSDAKEAIAFALFGYLGFHKQPNNLPAATGASKEVIMGKIAW